MEKIKKQKYIQIVLWVMLCLVLLTDLTFSRYAGEWDHSFGLLVSPSDQYDLTVQLYFRSNTLKPESEEAAYPVNGTSTWFTVANGLDSSTVSQDDIEYELTWYASVDGVTWTEYKNQSATLPAGEYTVAKHTVEPIIINETMHNFVKVVGATTSFKQENIEATYSFTYEAEDIELTYADGIITVSIDTNDVSGSYKFEWIEGITPDNSDPNGVFTAAVSGPSSKVVTLNLQTAYKFVFFITGDIDGEPTDAVVITRQ